MDHRLTKADQVVNEPRKSQQNGTDILQLTSECNNRFNDKFPTKRAKRRRRLTDTQTIKVFDELNLRRIRIGCDSHADCSSWYANFVTVMLDEPETDGDDGRRRHGQQTPEENTPTWCVSIFHESEPNACGREQKQNIRSKFDLSELRKVRVTCRAEQSVGIRRSHWTWNLRRLQVERTDAATRRVNFDCGLRAGVFCRGPGRWRAAKWTRPTPSWADRAECGAWRPSAWWPPALGPSPSSHDRPQSNWNEARSFHWDRPLNGSCRAAPTDWRTGQPSATKGPDSSAADPKPVTHAPSARLQNFQISARHSSISVLNCSPICSTTCRLNHAYDVVDSRGYLLVHTLHVVFEGRKQTSDVVRSRTGADWPCPVQEKEEEDGHNQLTPRKLVIR